MRDGNSLIRKGIYQFGRFQLSTAERVLRGDGEPISVAPKALDVLIVLVENRGQIVEKDELIRKIWPETFVEDNNLAFNISVLRKLLGESSALPRFIETVPKRGYRFRAEEVSLQQELDAPEKLDENFTAQTTFQEAASNRQIRKSLFIRSTQTRTLVITMLALLVGGAIVVQQFLRKPKLTSTDGIVLADLTNNTGDPVFDGTLRQELAIELGQSPFLSLVSDERIQRMLPLIGQPKSVRLTPELAREICERTASAAVVEGSIAGLGSEYVLSLRAKNCRTGAILDEELVQAATKEDVLNALSQITRKFRARIGESLATIEKHDTPLEVTTTSLDALSAFSGGLKVAQSKGEFAAVPFLKRAIELDPKFATAYAMLARFYADMGESVLSSESTRKAYELRDRASDNERFYIMFTYDRQVTGNLEKALQTLEVWARTYPHEVNAHGLMSGFCSQGTGRYQTTIKEAQIAIGLDPELTPPYLNLAFAYLYLDRLSEAEATVQRLAARKVESSDFHILRYHLAFLKADQAGMEREAGLAGSTPGAADWMLHLEALVAARSGQLRLARSASSRAMDLAEHLGDPERAAIFSASTAVWEGFFGNFSAARRDAREAHRLSKARDVEYGAAFALAVSGDLSQSLSLAEDLERRFPEDTTVRFNYLPVLHGLFELSRNSPLEAVEKLQMAVPYDLALPGSAFFGFFGTLYPTYIRGEAYLAAHQGANAVAQFQTILDHRGLVLADPMGAMARLQLARAFALAGDNGRAKTAYQDFLSLWRGADFDVPMLKQAKTEYAKL
jgi:DNA-binding winged helix-turn-helix (wHTH) protein/Tfp pilus assembly protein PilF